jgi:hypothetical protein
MPLGGRSGLVISSRARSYYIRRGGHKVLERKGRATAEMQLGRFRVKERRVGKRQVKGVEGDEADRCRQTDC